MEKDRRIHSLSWNCQSMYCGLVNEGLFSYFFSSYIYEISIATAILYGVYISWCFTDRAANWRRSSRTKTKGILECILGEEAVPAAMEQ